MLKYILGFFFSISYIYADTMEHYMNIANNIPKMEMKADSQSQAWARSARNILALTSESILQSLLAANTLSTERGNPLFCPPGGADITPDQMNQIIQSTYNSYNGGQAHKNQMTVSQMAMLGLTQKYPCQNQPSASVNKPTSNMAQQSQSSQSAPAFFNAPPQMQHQSRQNPYG